MGLGGGSGIALSGDERFPRVWTRVLSCVTVGILNAYRDVAWPLAHLVDVTPNPPPIITHLCVIPCSVSVL